MKKALTQRLGLLGIVSFLSYTAAVVFSPIAYPGYNRTAQAVSDLSAADAPPRLNGLKRSFRKSKSLSFRGSCSEIKIKKIFLKNLGFPIDKVGNA